MPLPRIACFHGGGSTAPIFKIQCSRLATLLSDTFEFVFFEAPFERSAGPGVLPFFNEKEYGPYKTWFRDLESDDGAGYDENEIGRSGVERVWELMRDAGEGGEWVGAMGFSQGSRVVGGLLLDQQVRRRVGLKAPGDVELRFGVLCMGSGRPMVSEMSRDTPFSNGEVERISIPTWHLHGLKDKQLENGRIQMQTFYEPKTTRVMEIDYHHAMPWNKDDLAAFTEFVRDAYNSTKDS